MCVYIARYVHILVNKEGLDKGEHDVAVEGPGPMAWTAAATNGGFVSEQACWPSGSFATHTAWPSGLSPPRAPAHFVGAASP